MPWSNDYWKKKGQKLNVSAVDLNGVMSPSEAVAADVQPVQTQPATGVEMPKLTDYQQNQQMFEQLMTKPMSEEEEQKRIRGAQSAQLFGNLGNVLSAFSNLIYTGKGAPSQTLPTVPDAGIQKFEDRVAERRKQYAAGLMGAKAKDTQDYYNAVLNYYRGEQDKRAAEKHKADMASAKNNEELAKYNIEYARLRNEGYPTELANKIALNNAKINTEKANAYKYTQQGNKAAREGSGSGSGSSTKVRNVVIGSNGSYFVRDTEMGDNEKRVLAENLEPEELANYGIPKYNNVNGAKLPVTGEDGKPVFADYDWGKIAQDLAASGRISTSDLFALGYVERKREQSSGGGSGKGKKKGTGYDNDESGKGRGY